MSDELLSFVNEEPDPEIGLVKSTEKKPWKILVVDDDQEVLDITMFILKDIQIFGRPLNLLNAMSGRDAREVLKRHPDVAVALLDVVMETPSAGLDLVGFIRKELGLSECRIILRTGQPGYAPELSTIQSYDINDYRTKSELTMTRLITMISSAIKSYEQIHALAENRKGLELIIHASSDLLAQHAIAGLSQGVLTQLAALLKLPPDGLVCTQRGAPFAAAENNHYIVGAIGRHARFITRPLSELRDERISSAIINCLSIGEHIFAEDYTVFYLETAPEQETAVFLDSGEFFAEMDRALLDVFVANISACFRNVKLVERLNSIAYYDLLTKLPNRLWFINNLEDIKGQSRGLMAVLIDLCHFAELNNGMGQDFGNSLLIAVSERLISTLGAACSVARIGGDVFGITGPADLLEPARLFSVFLKPFTVDGYSIHLNITMGLCDCINNDDTGINILKRTNIALNQAKISSGHYQYFKPDMEETTRWRVDVISSLRRDFESDKLQVWYQPQLSLSTSKIVGLEALLRWPSESGFTHPPSVFIPLAEHSGLILRIGDWVLRQACKELTVLNENGYKDVKIAVNVSMAQLRRPDFVEDLARIIDRGKADPSLLELEITESIAIEDPENVLKSLEKIKNLGLQIAIDDFGTGYSSLNQIHSLPIDCLKIDRSFVSGINDGNGSMIAETIVDLSRKFGFQSIAEGIETREQVEFLKNIGCPVGQGFLFAQPMPGDKLVQWLISRDKQ